ncbi:WD repeat-containing protein 86 isoform X1 [Falco naumanni]|uniref:WD repeat-containing protein 86 isoform X1 n=1 Tax=Falco peregrinus TaxID=8954 RepID=UPI000FFB262F|nr:WD repeat-containing protein 86 isoform X1 [Falco peregrinus]XP_040446992.1 WD repeat-containing protein 86 isoform X1 [Falco naumanni]XP_040446993.1 WD repeat-containing protein 86 isoform X1 [Falco naumanni]XP_055660917.1 WD repeat-containing protein 86 isoform X1 [Falco peregrinus]XP_055660918.1 WD repeat-containing protein 86 isoform X1 [Falco peregrinus]
MGNSGSAVKVCTDHQGGINWLSLSPDGQRLLTGSEDGTARLWSTADSQCHGHFQGHESYITFCHLENEAAFTCSADHTIRKWDVMTGQCLAIYRGHTSIVNRILVAKDYLFSGSYDRTARCWSVDKEKQIQEFRGHRNCVLTLAHYSSRDVLEEEEEEEEEEEKVSRDLLVTGSTDCTVKVWWVSSGRCYQTLLGHTGAVLCLILDAPNRELFSGSTDYTIRTWNIVTGEQLKVFKEHQGSVICLELVNRHLYSGSADRTVKCWLVDTGERIQTYKAHKHSVSTLKYHAGILFTGSGDACARAFNSKSGVLQKIFRGHKFIINCIQFDCADSELHGVVFSVTLLFQIHNELLYTASHDGTLRIWDIRGICKRNKRRLKKERSAQGRSSQKGSLSRLFNNKVGCMVQQENGEHEAVELM